LQRVSKSNSERQIRVFISSTFRDMKDEREELVKQVFPQLRYLCERRGVTWGEVDLRWGVTDEARAEGMLLPLCLAEIERCRPYFIGLLGERYGWVASSLSKQAALLSGRPERRRECLRLAQDVLDLSKRHGFGDLSAGIGRFVRSIPPV
jgi:hypothetical protein